MSSDSVNMSGAEGFFGLAPAMNKNNQTNTGWVSSYPPCCKTEYLELVFDSHTLQSSKYAAGGTDSQALDYKPATEWTHDRKKQN